MSGENRSSPFPGTNWNWESRRVTELRLETQTAVSLPLVDLVIGYGQDVIVSLLEKKRSGSMENLKLMFGRLSRVEQFEPCDISQAG